MQFEMHLIFYEVESWYRGRVETLDAKYSLIFRQLSLWPHEMESWFHSWYRGRVETLDAKYNLIFRQLSLNCQCGHMKWSHGFILGTEVGQKPIFRQLSLNCQCGHMKWGHMKWSHGFILGTEVGQRPQMLNIVSYLGSSLLTVSVAHIQQSFISNYLSCFEGGITEEDRKRTTQLICQVKEGKEIHRLKEPRNLFKRSHNRNTETNKHLPFW